MNLVHLLDELERNHVSIALDGEDLQLSFADEEINPRLVQKIRQGKSALIDYLRKYAPTTRHEAIPKAKVEQMYPLSDAQYRIWMASQFESGSLAYNLPNVLELRGEHNLATLEKAIKAVIRRHEILRTVFKQDRNGEQRQQVLTEEDLHFELGYRDLSNHADRQALLQQFISEDNKVPFDLEKGPLLRAYLLKLEDEHFILYYNIHHIISDGWSMGILTNEVIAFYEAEQQGRSPNLRELNIQYKDYVAWQLEKLGQAKHNENLQFWQKQLSGELPIMDLPSNKIRPKVKTYNGRVLKTYISKEALAGLKAFGLEHGGTLFMTLQAIWVVLLYRYTSQKDIIIGSPVAGRDHPDLRSQIGCYINTLVLRNQVDPQERFLEFYNRLKANTLEAYGHPYPFDRLVKELSPKRDISRSLIFDVLLVLQNTGIEIDEVDLPENATETITRSDLLYSKVDLELSFKEEGMYLAFDLIYNVDVYEQQMLENLMIHFKQLLQNVIREPDTALGRLSYLSPKEKKQILQDFNDTLVAYEGGATILTEFETQVKKRPNAPAVVFESITLSYQQLEDYSNQFASYLIQEYGVGASHLVGLQLERSEWMLIAILGIMKSGAAYVPIGTNYPKERVAFIQEDCGFKAYIDQQELEKFKARWGEYSVAALKISVKVQGPAYAIYTSGSTGRPKGVVNHHLGLYNRLAWMQADLDLSEEDIFLQKTPYTFDVSVWELLLPLFCGATLVFAKPEGHKDPAYLQGIIEKHGVSIIHFVPSMLDAFLASAEKGSCQSLNNLVCSGEALSSNLAISTWKLLPKVRIHNFYGPTEATIDVSAIELNYGDVQEKGVSIGFPVANTKLYIVNERMDLQGIGIPGELIIGGVQLANGYLNRPELNEKRFTQDPFNDLGRIYKTGDLARWLPNGEIEFLGRKDNQVKIRGNRVELGEVESLIQESGMVSRCVVLLKEDALGNKRLIAYVQALKEYSQEGIYTYLRSKMPDYMLPALFVELQEFPLNLNGKLDRKALPEPFLSSVRTIIAARNPTEEQLVSIWLDTLGFEEISVTDNFFLIGGDSIIAVRMMNAVHKRFSKNIKLEQLYEHPTIEALAKIIDTGDQLKEREDELRKEAMDSFEALKAEIFNNQ